jgi:endoglucanase
MRNIFSVCLLLITLQLHAQPVQQHGVLHVNAVQLVDSKNEPVVLRGMSFGWSCFHPRFYTAGSVHTLVNDWHCNVIRASLGVEPKNGYKEDSATQIQLIRNVVEACIKEGVYVLIDWHSHNINLKEAKAFFTTMAKDYGKYPNVIYELYNEPDYESWDSVKLYSTELISTIRKIDPDNLILVGNPHWDQDIHLVAEAPLQHVSNIMYTVHFYAATHKQQLRNRCDAALAKGIPIFISESAGMDASGDGPLNDEEWKRWIDWCEQHKISWIVWSVSDKNETCSVLQTSASSNGGWQQTDLKESGIKSREFIRKYNAQP